MAEYIEREATIKAIDHEVSLDGLYVNIKAIPAADVRPERHSHWHEYESCVFMGRYGKDGEPIFQDRKKFMCVKCGRNTIIKETFCPSCGAKMDGKGSE